MTNKLNPQGNDYSAFVIKNQKYMKKNSQICEFFILAF